MKFNLKINKILILILATFFMNNTYAQSEYIMEYVLDEDDYTIDSLLQTCQTSNRLYREYEKTYKNKKTASVLGVTSGITFIASSLNVASKNRSEFKEWSIGEKVITMGSLTAFIGSIIAYKYYHKKSRRQLYNAVDIYNTEQLKKYKNKVDEYDVNISSSLSSLSIGYYF